MHLENHYKLPPMAARTLSQDVVIWQDLFQNNPRRDGQIVYNAVKTGQPPCKAISECELVSVRLTILDPDDISFLKSHDLQSLNRLLLKRICRESVDQGGVLSVEDAALILRLSQRTVKRHRKAILSAGEWLVMRGDSADMGPGSTHVEAIVRLFILGYSETEISLRTCHSLESVEAYARDFLRVSLLHRDNYSPARICGLTRLSKKKVWAIIDLYKKFDDDPAYASALRSLLDVYELRRDFIKKGART